MKKSDLGSSFLIILSLRRFEVTSNCTRTLSRPNKSGNSKTLLIARITGGRVAVTFSLLISVQRTGRKGVGGHQRQCYDSSSPSSNLNRIHPSPNKRGCSLDFDPLPHKK